jgi:bifunctional non-homologous end joining protein LigD
VTAARLLGYKSRARENLLSWPARRGRSVSPMFQRRHTLEPCLSRPAKEPPSGPEWIHEIKHDGFRILARREAARVRLYTRNGYDYTARFPKFAATVESLRVRSCVLDGEAIIVDERGLGVRRASPIGRTIMPASMCFRSVELDGADFRSRPLQGNARRAALQRARRHRLQ